MTCRAPTAATTCTGSTPTGAQLGYDDEGQLTTGLPGSPSTTTTTASATTVQGGQATLHAASATKATATTSSSAHDEVVHTTTNHPWLTADHGWLPAGQLVAGLHVVRADGSTAVVVGEHVVPGAASMWNLTVSNLHTYAVGAGQYVVHNCAQQVDPANEAKLNKYRAKYETRALPDGRTRFYDKFKPRTNPGPTAGGRYVREFNPETGQWRGWYETYRDDGSVYAVHPKYIGNNSNLDLPHYWFDHGRFLGTY